jgi:nucleoside phosphorylase
LYNVAYPLYKQGILTSSTLDGAYFYSYHEERIVTQQSVWQLAREDFEIAIVCTKNVEYNAVCLVLHGFWDDDGEPFGRAIEDFNTYTTSYMEGFNIVITLLCNLGKATAASKTASLRSSCPRIKHLLLTGICDGVPNAMGKELLLGDIAISDTVV